MTTLPLTVLVVRDPDGGTNVRVFSGDLEIDHDEVIVDAGRGYTIEDWRESADHDITAAEAVGPNLAQAVAAAYADPPGSQYIDGWGYDEED
jgi:hypothetical protein